MIFRRHREGFAAWERAIMSTAVVSREMPMTVAYTREPALAPSPPPEFGAAEIGRLAPV